MGLLTFLLVPAFRCERADNPEGLVVVPSRKIDLGTVCEETKDREGIFELENRGERVIRILSTRSSCGCLNVRLDQAVIESGEAATLRIRTSAPYTPGPNRYFVFVSTDDPNTPLVTLEVKWTYMRSWRVRPDRLVVENMEDGEVRERSVDVLFFPEGANGRLEATSLNEKIVSVRHVDNLKKDRLQRVHLQIRAGPSLIDEAGLRLTVTKADRRVETSEIVVCVKRRMFCSVKPPSVCLYPSQDGGREWHTVRITPASSGGSLSVKNVRGPGFLETTVPRGARGTIEDPVLLKARMRSSLAPGIYCGVIWVQMAEHNCGLAIPVICQYKKKGSTYAL